MGVCLFQINLHYFTIAQVLEYSVDDLLTALIREMEPPKCFASSILTELESLQGSRRLE